MPSNKTVAVVVVYTGKNRINAILLFLSLRKKEREREKKREIVKTKQKNAGIWSEWSEERVGEALFQLKKMVSETDRFSLGK